MKTTLELLVVVAVCILPHLMAALFTLTGSDYLKKLLPWQRTLSSLSHDASKFLLLGYVAANHVDGLAVIGLRIPAGKTLDTLLIGGLAAAYLSLIFVFEKFRSKQQQTRREELRRKVFEVGGFSRYKGVRERFGFLISVWISNTAEDLVFRGYLVLGLTHLTGIAWPWIGLSILLSVCIHLYQGMNREIALSQALFAVVFITVAVAAGNVVAAIIPHVIYDTVWMLRGWARDSQAQPQPS